jgi:hypothetical protein
MPSLLIPLIILAIFTMIAMAGAEARELADRGWVLYYIPGCIYCRQQIRALGAGAFFTKMRNCNTAAPGECDGIVSYPTWRNTITRQVHPGLIPRAALRETLEKSHAPDPPRGA